MTQEQKKISAMYAAPGFAVYHPAFWQRRYAAAPASGVLSDTWPVRQRAGRQPRRPGVEGS